MCVCVCLSENVEDERDCKSFVPHLSLIHCKHFRFDQTSGKDQNPMTTNEMSMREPILIFSSIRSFNTQ